jgi:hypothetical protein
MLTQVAQIVGSVGTLAVAVAALLSARAALSSSRAARAQVEQARAQARIWSQERQPELQLQGSRVRFGLPVDFRYADEPGFALNITVMNRDERQKAREVLLTFFDVQENRALDAVYQPEVGPGASVKNSTAVELRSPSENHRESWESPVCRVVLTYMDQFLLYEYAEKFLVRELVSGVAEGEVKYKYIFERCSVSTKFLEISTLDTPVERAPIGRREGRARAHG